MNWTYRTVIASLALSSLAAPAVADVSGQGSGYGHMWHGGWSGMVFGPFMMLVFLLIVVLAVFFAARAFGFGGGSSAAATDKQPLDVLKARFARGEIDKDEYQEQRRILEG